MISISWERNDLKDHKSNLNLIVHLLPVCLGHRIFLRYPFKKKKKKLIIMLKNIKEKKILKEKKKKKKIIKKNKKNLKKKKKI